MTVITLPHDWTPYPWQLDVLKAREDGVNRFAIAGRYPDLLFPLPTPAESRVYADRAKEVLACLRRRL